MMVVVESPVAFSESSL